MFYHLSTLALFLYYGIFVCSADNITAPTVYTIGDPLYIIWDKSLISQENVTIYLQYQKENAGKILYLSQNVNNTGSANLTFDYSDDVNHLLVPHNTTGNFIVRGNITILTSEDAAIYQPMYMTTALGAIYPNTTSRMIKTSVYVKNSIVNEIGGITLVVFDASFITINSDGSFERVKSLQATFLPTPSPTLSPTPLPTNAPVASPIPSPTLSPTPFPTNAPVASPTPSPTNTPTSQPTPLPTVPTPLPTLFPTPLPTPLPTSLPTLRPTLSPTSLPTPLPTPLPTQSPTTSEPTPTPTSKPTLSPTNIPTPFPTTPSPTPQPTKKPTPSPTYQPTTPLPTPPPTTASPTPPPTTPLPTPQPTTPSPTSQPSNRPTPNPTPLPITVPTSSPTTRPRSDNDRRLLNDNDNDNDDDDESYTQFNVTIVIVSADGATSGGPYILSIGINNTNYEYYTLNGADDDPTDTMYQFVIYDPNNLNLSLSYDDKDDITDFSYYQNVKYNFDISDELKNLSLYFVISDIINNDEYATSCAPYLASDLVDHGKFGWKFQNEFNESITLPQGIYNWTIYWAATDDFEILKANEGQYKLFVTGYLPQAHIHYGKNDSGSYNGSYIYPAVVINDDDDDDDNELTVDKNKEYTWKFTTSYAIGEMLHFYFLQNNNQYGDIYNVTYDQETTSYTFTTPDSLVIDENNNDTYVYVYTYQCDKKTPMGTYVAVKTKEHKKDSDSGGLSAGAIVGIVVAGVVVIGIAAWWLCMRKSSSDSKYHQLE